MAMLNNLAWHGSRDLKVKSIERLRDYIKNRLPQKPCDYWYDDYKPCQTGCVRRHYNHEVAVGIPLWIASVVDEIFSECDFAWMAVWLMDSISENMNWSEIESVYHEWVCSLLNGPPIVLGIANESIELHRRIISGGRVMIREWDHIEAEAVHILNSSTVDQDRFAAKAVMLSLPRYQHIIGECARCSSLGNDGMCSIFVFKVYDLYRFFEKASNLSIGKNEKPQSSLCSDIISPNV